MRFLVDNQLPAAVARFVRERGAESIHVLEIGLAQAADREVWQYAAEHQMILISKDEDFFQLASRPAQTVQFVWVRLGNCRTAVLVRGFEAAWSRILERLQAGERIVELR